LIPFWRVNPLNTTLVTLYHSIRRRPGRSMQSVHRQDERVYGAASPHSRQESAIRGKRSMRCILPFAWIVGMFAVVWLPLTWLIRRRGPDRYFRFMTDDALHQLEFRARNTDFSMPLPLQTFLGLLLYCGIQELQR
jgi:hypothetical protein